MQETFKQYTERILSYQAGKDPVTIQASTVRKIERLLEGVPRNKLMRRPAPAKWSVAEIVAHLAEDELVAGYRMRKILASPGTRIDGFDQGKWAITGKYAKRGPKASLEFFRALRRANLSLLKSLDPPQWRLSGIHSERGVETIRRIAEMYAGHDINHLKQIQDILRKTGRRQSADPTPAG